MNIPLVSICIPTYNGAQFIVEAMESAINQTYPNLEIIVSDDVSNDATLKIIEAYKEKTDIPIHIFHHEPNGIGANWNNCIKHAKGEYIKLLFQDDVLLPSCIQEMVHVLENDKSIGLVASKRTFIIENDYHTTATKEWVAIYGDLQKELHLPLINGVRILDKKLFKSHLFLKSPLNKVGEPPVTLFRSKLVKEIGYFKEDLKQILDYEFYYRVLKKYKIAILEKELVQFRLHPQQATNVNSGNDENEDVKYDYIIYKEYFWYVPWRLQQAMLRKYNVFIKFIMKIYNKISI